MNKNILPVGEFSSIYERKKALSVVNRENQGGEVHREKVRIAVGTVVVAMNLGTSSHGNGVRSAMFLRTLFYAELVLQ